MKQEMVNEIGMLLITFILGGLVFTQFVEVKDSNGNVYGCGIKFEKVEAK